MARRSSVVRLKGASEQAVIFCQFKVSSPQDSDSDGRRRRSVGGKRRRVLFTPRPRGRLSSPLRQENRPSEVCGQKSNR